MQENGRTKAVLCEMIIVALFLSLSSVTLLRLFAASNAISRESETVSHATLLAQDTLERLLAGETLPAVQEKAMGGQTYDVRVDVRRQPMDAGTLMTYGVSVDDGDGEVIAVESAAYRPEGRMP